MRIAADFENFANPVLKKRRLKSDRRNTITELLPVVDNSRRARSRARPAGAGTIDYKATKVNFTNSWLAASSGSIGNDTATGAEGLIEFF